MPDVRLPVKTQLYQHCNAYIEQRIHSIQQAITAAQQAGADDTKSSAGDKYETTREMMQQETNRNAAQLSEAFKIKAALSKINPDAQPYTQAGAGSLVYTTEGNFYIAIGAGSLLIDSTQYHTISQASPIGLQLQRKSVGEDFELNKKVYRINAIA